MAWSTPYKAKQYTGLAPKQPAKPKGPDPYQTYLQTQNAVNNANYEKQRQYGFEDTMQAQTGYDYGKRWLNADYNANNQLNNLDKYGNQIDIGAQQRLLAPGGVYATQQTGLGQRRGLLGAEFQNQLKGFGFDESTARRTNAANLRGVASDAAARGATVTEGTRNKNRDLYNDLVDQLGQIDVGRTGAGISHIRGNISLNDEQAGLTENKAQTADQIKKLNLQAQRLGITGQQLQNTLNQGLEKLGIDKSITERDIRRQMESNNAAEAQAATQLYYQALDYGGFIPQR